MNTRFSRRLMCVYPIQYIILYLSIWTLRFYLDCQLFWIDRLLLCSLRRQRLWLYWFLLLHIHTHLQTGLFKEIRCFNSFVTEQNCIIQRKVLNCETAISKIKQKIAWEIDWFWKNLMVVIPFISCLIECKKNDKFFDYPANFWHICFINMYVQPLIPEYSVNFVGNYKNYIAFLLIWNRLKLRKCLVILIRKGIHYSVSGYWHKMRTWA